MNPEIAAKSIVKRKSKYDLHGQSFIQHLREQQFNNRYSITDRKQKYDALNDPLTSYYFSSPSVKMHLKTFRKAIRQQPNQQQKKRISQLISRRITEKFKDFICPKTLVYEQEMTSLQIDALIKKSTLSLKHKRSRKSFASYQSNQDTDTKVSKTKKRYFPPVKQQTTHQINFGSQNASLQLQNEYKPSQKAKFSSTKQDRVRKLNELTETMTEKNKKSTQSELNSNTHMQQNLQKQLIMKSTLKDIQQRAYANKLAEQLHRKKHQKWLLFLSQKKHRLTQNKYVSHQKEKLVQTVIS